MQYTVDYFIKKFKKIPASHWCVRVYTDDKGRKCAYGHCGAVGGKRMPTEMVALEN